MIISKFLYQLIDKPISGEWGTEGGTVNVIRTANFTNQGIIDFSKVVTRNIEDKKIITKKLQEHDIIIEKSGGSPDQPVGRVVYFDKKGLFLCNNFTSILRPKQELIFPKYLHYILFGNHKFGFVKQFQNKTTGIINLQLPRYIKETKIPTPSLEEQKKIADILDAADSLRQKDKQLVEHYDRLSQSLFLDMFGDPVANPKGWPELCLDEMVDFITSGSRGWAKYYSDMGDIFIRIQNVGKNELMLNDLTYVDAPDNAESKRTAVQAGDILLSITADLGRTAVIPSEFPKAHINQHLAIIRLKSGYNPYYISEFIASEGGKRQFIKLDKGGVKAGLNFTDIKSLKLLNPPLNIQNQYLKIVKEIKNQKLLAQQALKKSEDLFNSLLQQAFKGELTNS